MELSNILNGFFKDSFFLKEMDGVVFQQNIKKRQFKL